MGKSKYIAFVVAALFLSTGISAFAQNAIKDTLLNRASGEMYTHPQASIKKGLQVYEESGNDSHYQILSLILVSNAYFSIRNNKEAKYYAFRALELAENSSDYANQVKVYGLLGNHYQILKLNEKARYYLDKAEVIMQKHTLPPDMRYLRGNIFAVKGNSYKNDLDCDFAITYFDKAMYEFMQSPHRSAIINLHMVQVQKGFCLLEKQMPDLAAAIFKEVLKNTSAQKMYDSWIYAKIGMARSHFLKKEYPQAIAQLNEGLAATINTGRADIDHELYRNLSNNYIKLDDYPHYLYYNTLYQQTLKEVTATKESAVNELVNELSADAKAKIADTNTTYRTYVFILAAVGLITVFAMAIAILKQRKMANTAKKTIFRKTLNS